MLKFFSSIQTNSDTIGDKPTKIIAVFIVLASLTLAIGSFWNDSIIVDEDPHIGAGYSYLVKRDMRLNPEHPPLAKDISAIPLLFLNLDDGAFETSAWEKTVNGQWDFGRKLIFNSGNDAQLITRLAKFPMLLFFILACWIVFKWTRERYGNYAGLLSLFIFSLSPTVMAHARFVATDIAALSGILVATYAFLQYLKNTSKKNLWIAGIAFGFALLTKFSVILLFPYFILLALLWQGWKTIYRTILVFIVGIIFIIGPVYYFHTIGSPPEKQRADTEHILSSQSKTILTKTVIATSDKPILRAYSQYGLGLLMVLQRSSGGNKVYYLGEIFDTSAGPWYFPFVYFVKEPLAWWILVALAILILIRQIFKLKISNLKTDFIRDNFVEIAMLLWIAIYWIISIRSSLNIGVRHLLPIYPFMIILVSGRVASIKKYKAIIFVVIALMIWYAGENLKVFPHYLSYFNQSVGGPSGGYRYVVDSNLDWGQDLKRFSSWVEENNIQKIELDYFGWADQYYYLGDRFLWLTSGKYPGERDFISNNTSDGWIAVSATYLMNNSDSSYAWLLKHEPVTVIGNSIFVYNIK